MTKGASYTTALTSEPEERLVRKLSRASWAVVTFPEPSAEPICASRSLNDVALLELLAVLVLVVDALDELEELDELLEESSRLVKES